MSLLRKALLTHKPLQEKETSMKINKGDIILIFILLATAVYYGINEFNIMNNLPQFESSYNTLFAVIFGGELLSFAIYRIGIAKYDSQTQVGIVKYDPQKNVQTIEQLEKDIEELQKQKGKHADEQTDKS